MKRNLTPNASAIEANDRFLSHRADLGRALLEGAARADDPTGTLTSATEHWLRELWQAAGDVDAALVALGGFGRRELCLGSDIDLVVEVGDGVDESAELLECMERFVAWGRLTKVKLVPAVRTVAQTMEAFGTDVRTAVSYLDAHPVVGVPRVGVPEALEVLRADDEGVGFVELMLEAYRARLARFGQTIYLLEPEVKSGKGGLRDIHVLRWAARVRGDFDAESDVSETFGWSAKDAAVLQAGHQWLLDVRGRLHALHGRKHDRLHFTDQEAVAALLMGPEPSESAGAAAERMMRRHYQVTRSVAKLVERALRRWGAAPSAIECRVDERFRVGGGQLFIDADGAMRPEEVLEGLRLASEYDVLLDPVAEERMETAVRSWGAEIVDDAAVCSVFRGLLTDPKSTPRTSTRLLELGILPRLVPEFEPVVCHVQHDVYHVYTTDVHLLRCLEFARALREPTSEVATRWPEFAAICAQIEDPQVFLLSALFHDIGKNRGGGHSEKGAAMMLDVGPRLGLEAERTALLAFLVREHLTLSHVARRHDIADVRLVRDLAARIRTVEALNQLTALTFCDMSTVGRTPVTDWNATLLQQLHARLEATIRHGVEEAWRGIERDVDVVRQWLMANVGEWRTHVDAFVRDLPASYLVETSAEAVARAFEAWRRGQAGETVVLATPDEERGTTEVIVSAPDKSGMLAQITGAISSLGLNILGARIITTASGRLLDVFQIAQSGGASHALEQSEQVAVTDAGRLQRLQERLQQVVAGEVDAADLLKKRLAQQKLAPRTTPEVDSAAEEIPDLSDDFTVVQIRAPDRIGLLYDIARTLAECRVDIRLSKVDSLGTQVVDTFYLETLDHRKLPPEQVDEVLAALRARLLASPG